MSLIDLYISDGGKIRRIGDNQHDMLTIEDGELCYYNLQNGDGCRLGEDGEWYKFVENADEYGYNCDPRKTEPTVDKDINVRSKDEPQVVMPKKCKGCDSASEIIEAYSKGFEDGAEAVKAIKVKALHKDYIEPYVTIEDEPQERSE